MSSEKIDYTELVNALQEYNGGKSNELLKQLLPRLCSYLEVTMDARPQDAEEAVQQAFLNTYKRVLEDGIKDKKYFYKYILLASRLEYVRLMEYDDRYAGEMSDSAEYLVTPPQQINNLIDKQQQKFLKECLEELRDRFNTFIMYVFKHPEINTRALSEHFDISEGNARAKKFQIIKRLSKCVKKKSGEYTKKT